MGVVIAVFVAVVWVAVAVAATVWALRSRRHHREDAVAAAAAAAAVHVDLRTPADDELTDQLDLSDAGEQLPSQREG